MKALKNLSLILLLVLTFTGCHDKSSKLADFNRTAYTPEYASGFNIKGADSRKSVLVTVTNPWQGADSITTCLFIARDGEAAPEDFTGQVLNGNAGRIVCMSSTHIAMLDAIGETGRVVGVSGIDYISNPDIQARRDSVGDVGYEGNINYELLLSLDPDLVLLYGVNGASSMEGKLKELNIPFMYVGEYLGGWPRGGQRASTRACDAKVHELHLMSAKRVCAKGQAEGFRKIEPLLDDEEMGVYKRGRNSHLGTVAKNATISDYRTATGLETLIGYLYLNGRDERLTELMKLILE